MEGGAKAEVGVGVRAEVGGKAETDGRWRWV